MPPGAASALRKALEELRRQRPIDVAIVRCGAVQFPRALGLGHARFTFDAAEAAEVCALLDAGTVVPVHRSGWAHFQQSEDDVRAAFDAVGLSARVRLLELGSTLEI